MNDCIDRANFVRTGKSVFEYECPICQGFPKMAIKES